MTGKYWLLRKAPRVRQTAIQSHPAAVPLQVTVNRRKFIVSWLTRWMTMRISVHDKGKEPLVEDEPVKVNPARETVELICGDVQFLVRLRDQTLEEKEKLMLEWAGIDSLETAVKRRLYILAKYGEMLLRKFLESHQKYLFPGQPWTATTSQIIDLFSVAHSKYLEVLVTQQKENGLPIEQPCTSTYLDTSIVYKSLNQPLLMGLPSTGLPLQFLQKDDSFDQENLYFVESPESPPRPLLSQDSTSSSSDSQMNFDDTDIAAPAPTISQPCFSTVSPDITEAIHQLRTSLDQISNRDNGAALKDVILLHLHDIEKKFTTRFDAQDRWFGTLRKDSNDQRNLLSLEIKSSQRQINTQIAAATIDQIDMQREVKELNAKVDAMATNLEILRRNAEATKEAISHQLLEFEAKNAADILSLSIQIGELVDHIRGGDAKKGEIGSSSRRPPPVRVERRPLPTQANQSENSSGHGRVLDVEEAAEMVREADRREREREREKRLRRLRRRGH
ncbi:hypothetical protein F511_24084 [Dorcoceras hygrometricum]|uniref:Uncharacterized protein n=1 Tax=Dorcoceras hygrometricum TaxID=472368 RepID=A0A2Z7B5N8_9LAMI|nr:hypothetical protein F511_24084 [Dorcoceras hygrometricum]